jgi:hypothetical protein
MTKRKLETKLRIAAKICRHEVLKILKSTGPNGKALIRFYASAIRVLPYIYRNDLELMWEAVHADAFEETGDAFGHVGEIPKNNKELVLSVLKQNITCFPHVGLSLRQDFDVVLAVVSTTSYGGYLYHAPHFKDHKEIVLAAVRSLGHSLKFASESMRADRGVVVAAVETDASALQFASGSLRDDKYVVMQGLPLTYPFASKRLKLQLDLVVQTVRHRNFRYKLLESVPECYRDDKDVVTTAVKNDGEALQYASVRLRNDAEVVMAAVQNNGISLKHASEHLRKQKEVIVAAIKQSPLAYGIFAQDDQDDQDDQDGRVRPSDMPLINIIKARHTCPTNAIKVIRTCKKEGHISNEIVGNMVELLRCFPLNDQVKSKTRVDLHHLVEGIAKDLYGPHGEVHQNDRLLVKRQFQRYDFYQD